MRHVKHITTLLASLAMLSLDAGTARALQLVQNFGFDAGTGGWSTCCNGFGTVSWDGTRDAYASSLSGSAKLVSTAAPLSDPVYLADCLTDPAIAPGTKLVYGMTARFASGESPEGLAILGLRFFGNLTCSGSQINSTGAGLETNQITRGSWISLHADPASAATVPAGTQSTQVIIALSKASPGTLTLNVDDVYVAPVGTPMCDGLPATQVGGPDSDFLNGTDDSDVIVGKGALDWIDGHGGNDRICGGPGDDVLYGGDGDDRLFGEGGKDTLLGVADDDLLYGAGNNDKLQGGTGNDVLRGGSGADTCEDADPDTAFRKCETVPAS